MNTLRRLSSSQKAIQQAWHEFVVDGRCKTLPREHILHAWQCARECGIDPARMRAPTVYDEQQIEQLLHTENLGIVGRKVLEKMSAVVEGTGHVMVLADDKGRIVYSVGHKKIQGELEKINFRPGGDWCQSVVGPNGIGTPLALAQPENINGSEHYCAGWKPWNCYGSPVHHPADHSLLGCIDITGPVHEFQSQGMALVVSIAQTIEAELALLHMQQREKLRQYFYHFHQQHPNDSVMLVDSCGQLLEHTSDMPDLLGSERISSARRQFKQPFPALWRIMQTVMEAGHGCDAEIATHHYPYLDKCTLLPVQCDAACSAALVIVTRSPISQSEVRHTSPSPITPLCAAQDNLQSIKDDVIQQALERNRGNVSMAARVLGINRSTIYRRMKHLAKPSGH